MTANRISSRWLVLWLAVLSALTSGRVLAQASVTIETPQDGSTVATSTLPRPRGRAGSSSGVGAVQVLVQRAEAGRWLSWNGSAWQAATAILGADYDAVSREWALSSRVALPASTSLVPGEYQVQARALAPNGSTLGNALVRFDVAPRIVKSSAPSNDLPEGATPISGLSGTASGSNVGAVLNEGADPDVFWKWTAPAEPSVVTFNTFGSNFNTWLVAFARDANGVWQEIATNNDTDGPQSRIRFGIEPNREYLIEVFGTGGERGNVVLNWSGNLRPINDLSTAPTVISGISGQVTGTNVDALSEGGDPDVFWKWTAPAEPAVVTFDTVGSNFNTWLVAFARDANGVWQEIATNNDTDGPQSRIRFGIEPNREYLIEVFGTHREQGNVVLNWKTDFRPANDLSENGTPISGASGRVTGTNVDALSEGADPDVFWKWTAPTGATSKVTFDTFGSNFNTWLVAHDRDANGVWQEIASNDNTDNLQSRISFEARPGREYLIEVFGTHREQGNVVLNWATVQRPVNDLASNATPISGPSGTVRGTNVGALPHDLDGNIEGGSFSQPDVFWKWTAPREGPSVVTFDTRGSGIRGSLYVFDGRNQIVTAASQTTTFAAEPGRAYLISVSEANGATGAITLNWNTAFRPVNDTAAKATLISGPAGGVGGTNVAALGHASDHSTTVDNSEPEVFWKWTAPLTGAPVAVFNTNGSNFDTIMAVHRRSPAGRYSEVARDDDSGEGNASQVRFAAEPGREYLIEVWGKNSTTGFIALGWGTSYRPANDAPAQAALISGGAGRVTGSNVDALGHGPTGNPESGENDVWWKWRAPAGLPAPATFDLNGSRFDDVIAVWKYEGRAGSYTLVGTDNSGSQRIVSFTTVPSAEYLIEVRGNSGRAGFIRLNWNVVSTGTVQGRLSGTGTVFLVPGDSIDSFVIVGANEGVRRATLLNGEYRFTNVAAGTYTVVPQVPGFRVNPLSTRVSVAPATTATANFTLGTRDVTGPEIKVSGMTRAMVNDAFVATSLAGTATDSGGVLRIGYAVYRLKGDAASLKLPPGRRPYNAVYSRLSRAFIDIDPTALPTLDNFFTAPLAGNAWKADFEADLKAALAAPGTYRVAIAGVDSAFNFSRNAASSTDPNRPAGGNAVYAHFSIRPARAVVSRTLPLSVTNGELFTYALSVSNSGDLPLEGVTVRQTINTNQTSLQGATISPPANQITATDVVWNLGRIPAHTTRLLRLQVKASANNPFGTDAAAGALRVTNTGGARGIFFGRDQVNIESSIPFGNIARSLGEALGSFFNPAFGTSLRDQRAQAALRTITTDTGVTRLKGADAIRFGNRAMLVPVGGGQVLAIGPSSLLSGGARIEADGGVAVVAGNAVTIASTATANILKDLLTNPQRVLAVTTALGGANLALLGGNNLVAVGIGPGTGVRAQGGGQFIDNSSGLISNAGIKLIGLDSSTLIGLDGGTLAGGLDGAGLVGNDGASLKLAAGQGNTLIGLDGGSLIGNDGGTLIGLDGSTLIGLDGGT